MPKTPIKVTLGLEELIELLWRSFKATKLISGEGWVIEGEVKIIQELLIPILERTSNLKLEVDHPSSGELGKLIITLKGVESANP